MLSSVKCVQSARNQLSMVVAATVQYLLTCLVFSRPWEENTQLRCFPCCRKPMTPAQLLGILMPIANHYPLHEDMHFLAVHHMHFTVAMDVCSICSGSHKPKLACLDLALLVVKVLQCKYCALVKSTCGLWPCCIAG